jgi:hypothetical protein
VAPAYPYALKPLQPVWDDRKARVLGALIVAGTLLACALHWPRALKEIDALALLVLLPGALAFVLAFAPRPATRGNRIAKDLVVCWMALGVFAGTWLPLMIVAVPVLLALAVFAARTEWARRIWGDDR